MYIDICFFLLGRQFLLLGENAPPPVNMLFHTLYRYIAYLTRGRDNVQSTQKWEVNNLFVQSIFQFCAVNFSMLINNICIILINFWRHYVRCIPCAHY